MLNTPWCSETWSYSKPDAPQITDSCEARVATQDESAAVTIALEELMVIGLRVRCSSPSELEFEVKVVARVVQREFSAYSRVNPL